MSAGFIVAKNEADFSETVNGGDAQALLSGGKERANVLLHFRLCGKLNVNAIDITRVLTDAGCRWDNAFDAPQFFLRQAPLERVRVRHDFPDLSSAQEDGGRLIALDDCDQVWQKDRPSSDVLRLKS